MEDKNPQTVQREKTEMDKLIEYCDRPENKKPSAADMRQLANLERAATRGAISLTDVVKVKDAVMSWKAGKRGIVVEVFPPHGYRVLFPDGVSTVYIDNELIRVAASLGE